MEFSHISAYNTHKNLRISLQGKLERQPLGNIQNLGTGRIKKIFTDDIDQIELLSLVPLVLGLFAMGMMMKSGFEKMNEYYESAAVMNNTIIEYVNGMEVVKVFNKDGDSYRRFGEVVRNLHLWAPPAEKSKGYP